MQTKQLLTYDQSGGGKTAVIETTLTFGCAARRSLPTPNI